MKMDVLRCQTVRGILKELTMFLLVYNLVRMTMVEGRPGAGNPRPPHQLCRCLALAGNDPAP